MYYNIKFSMMHYYLVALALTVGDRQRVLAANDWLVPCLQGQCSWDLPVDSGASGNLQIVRSHSHLPTCPKRAFEYTDDYPQWGPTTAISDITSAAGWQITHCDSEATAQDIQLVCANANSSCDHLFQGGAVDTIVRLPDEVGSPILLSALSILTEESLFFSAVLCPLRA
jgi:hypothetical protein